MKLTPPIRPMKTLPPLTVRKGIFGYFDTRGRYWTPAWDHNHNQPEDVAEVRLVDGTWHEFDGFVCQAEAMIYRIKRHLGTAK